MKKIATLFVFILALGSQAIAAQLSSLNLRTSSNIPIKVILNGQLITDGSQIASINNIRPGYHDLHVYYKIQDYFGVREEVLFLDKIFLAPNTVTHAVINEQRQYVVEQQLAMQQPINNPNQVTYDNQYATKPVFWSTNNTQTQAHCGTVPQQIVHPMNSDKFHQLKIAINNQWFSDGKMTVIKQAISNNYFTTQQVNELINLFSFSSDRLQVAKMAYTQTLDPENYFMVYESLQWNSSIQNLSNYIASL